MRLAVPALLACLAMGCHQAVTVAPQPQPIASAMPIVPSADCPEPGPVSSKVTYYVPDEQASAFLEPPAPCPGKVFTLTASAMVPNIAVDVWLLPADTGSRPAPIDAIPPSENEGVKLGTAYVDGTGHLKLSAKLSDPFSAMREPGGGFELWLVAAPDPQGRAPLYPAAATWVCTSSPRPAPTAPPPLLLPVIKGAASEAYSIAAEELRRRGYSTWRLHGIDGSGGRSPGFIFNAPNPDSIAATGLATTPEHNWTVYLTTDGGQVAWRTEVVMGRATVTERADSSEYRFRRGQEIDLSRWRIDSHEAVPIAGAGLSGGGMSLQRAPSIPTEDPFWLIDIQGASPFVNANTGQRL